MYIIKESEIYEKLKRLLFEKVKEGVEVRFMYDGTCSLILLPYNYPKKMEKMGITLLVDSMVLVLKQQMLYQTI